MALIDTERVLTAFAGRQHGVLAVEVDGTFYHRSAGSIEDDRRREAALTIAGWTVLRFSAHQVAEAPDQVLAALRTALARGGYGWI
jgi:very-short-patch-repair endonuclease